MIIPVLDIKEGICVSGKSGNRNTYTKLESVYGDNPFTIARNLKKDGAKLLYIADLDKIEENGNNDKLISQVNEIIPVLLDNGISSLENIETNKKICTTSILATETMENLEEVTKILKRDDIKDTVISIDIKNNHILIKNNDISLEDIISLINIYKPKYTIILNITKVGTKQQSNDKLVETIINKTPNTTHIIAGGITNESIKEYTKNNINNFLIGTQLHEGKLQYKL